MKNKLPRKKKKAIKIQLYKNYLNSYKKPIPPLIKETFQINSVVCTQEFLENVDQEKEYIKREMAKKIGIELLDKNAIRFTKRNENIDFFHKNVIISGEVHYICK